MLDIKKLSNVLCVDDEASILGALSRLLTKSGFNVMTAGSASEGLAKVQNCQLDVAICDMRMPGRNGADFFQTYTESIRMPTVY